MHKSMSKAKKLSSSNNNESVVLQKLSLNVLTFHPERNPLLLPTSVESLSGSMEGSSGK